MTRIVHCPTCDKDVAWSADSPERPFCSERCRLIDLGEWASEGYRIPERGSDGDGDGDAIDPLAEKPT